MCVSVYFYMAFSHFTLTPSQQHCAARPGCDVEIVCRGDVDVASLLLLLLTGLAWLYITHTHTYTLACLHTHIHTLHAYKHFFIVFRCCNFVFTKRAVAQLGERAHTNSHTHAHIHALIAPAVVVAAAATVVVACGTLAWPLCNLRSVRKRR